MARNAKNSSRQGSSRVTKAPVRRDPAPTRAQQQRDRRRFWLQILCGFLVLAMLLPVIAAFL